jgi:hypothetical protein
VTSHLLGEGRYNYSHLAQTLFQEEAVDQEALVRVLGTHPQPTEVLS